MFGAQPPRSSPLTTGGEAAALGFRDSLTRLVAVPDGALNLPTGGGVGRNHPRIATRPFTAGWLGGIRVASSAYIAARADASFALKAASSCAAMSSTPRSPL